MEFGGSGEDSFVAVVVTKLTGALLFILLLTMVIMALIPKAVDLPAGGRPGREAEATAAGDRHARDAPRGDRRPALCASRWRRPEGGPGRCAGPSTGRCPRGWPSTPRPGLIRGTPKAGTPEPVELVLRVSDGASRAAAHAALVVYQSDRPLTTPSRWKPGLPPIPWRAWLEQGFGFLVLLLVHLVGMNVVVGDGAGLADGAAEEAPRRGRDSRPTGCVLRLVSLGRGGRAWRSGSGGARVG